MTPSPASTTRRLFSLLLGLTGLVSGWSSAVAATTEGEWHTVAAENQSFLMANAATVRYGTGTAWVQRPLTSGQYTCSNGFFGQDPAVGTGKVCQVAGSLPKAEHRSDGFAPPITITRGGAYRGNWESLDPTVPAVCIQTSEPVTITGSRVCGKGTLIAGFRLRLTLTDSVLTGINPDVAGWAVGRAVTAVEATLQSR